MMRTKRNKFVWPKLSIKSLLKQGCKKEEFGAEEELETESEAEDDDCLRRHSFSIPSFEFDRWSSAGQHRRHSSALSAQNDLKDGLNTKQNFRIFIGTWNVGGRRPQDKVNLEQWLTLTEPADIYVIGFQEVVPLNAGNVLGAEDKSSAEQWLRLIQNALNNNKHCDPVTPPSRKTHMVSDGIGYFVSEIASSTKRADPFLLSSDHNLEFSFPLPEELLLDESFGRSESGISFRSHTSDDKETSTGCDSSPPLSPMFSARAIACTTRSNKSCYTVIASKRMVGIFLSVWVRSNLQGYVQHVKISSVGCGIMGYLGNKGSISVSLCLHETTFCFICSHLTSGEKEGDELRRNYDVSVILKRTRFRRSSKCSGKTQPITILDHDRVLWFGDLNYRLALSSTSTKLLLARGDWETLLERDQLQLEQRAGRVFKGWHEGKICFPPTYKYRMGSDCYAVERLKFGEKRRTPAWCDRILWYGKGLRQLEYVRAESNFSDHRPVYAVFSAEVEVPDSRKLRDFLV